MGKTTSSVYTTISLAVVFILLGSCRVLLIKFSANEEGKYDYLPVTVNVCAELIKLLVCGILALQVYFTGGRRWREALCVTPRDVLDTMKWAIPGLLYFFDNLLTFYIIKYFQPAVVVLLGNVVIITTSVLFRLVLKRKLTKVQWAALVILFLAILSLSNQSTSSVMVDNHRHHAVNHLVTRGNNSEYIPSLQPEVDVCQGAEAFYQVVNRSMVLESDLVQTFRTSDEDRMKTFKQFRFNEGHLLVLLQCLLSSSANIYNEKIFKEGNGVKESIYIQNSKLYFFGVIFNVLSLVIHKVYRQKILYCGFFYGHNAYSLILIFLTSVYGLTVAFILKFRDNMFHILSAQVVTIIVISASMYFFKFHPRLDFFLVAPIVLVAIFLFHAGKEKEHRFQESDVQPHIFHRERLISEQSVEENSPNSTQE